MGVQELQTFSKEMLIVISLILIGIVSILMGIAKWWGVNIAKSIKREFAEIKGIVELHGIKIEANERAMLEIHDGIYVDKYDVNFNKLLAGAKYVQSAK